MADEISQNLVAVRVLHKKYNLGNTSLTLNTFINTNVLIKVLSFNKVFLKGC